ncbi:hypothetical protein ACWDYH_37830 [Nocardia goodfellowii]
MFHRARHARARRAFVHRQTRRARLRWVTVYLATDTRAFAVGYTLSTPIRRGDRFALDCSVREADFDVLQRIFDASFDHEVVLGRIFAAFNDMPEHGDEPITRRWYRARHRSLSVGDVVALGSSHYACASLGWHPVPPPCRSAPKTPAMP